MPDTRLSGLDALCLAAESARAPLHTAALLLIDSSTGSGCAATDALMAAIRASVDRRARLRSVLVEAPFGLALPHLVDEHEPDLDHHLARVRVPRPGGPRELGALVDDIISRPLPRGCPLWEIHLVEGLASGALALVVKLHCVPLDGSAAWHLARELTREARSAQAAVEHDERPRAAATSHHPLLAPMRLARASAGLIGVAIRDWTSDAPGRSPRPTPPTGSRLNATMPGGRRSAHATLSVVALEKIAKAFSVSLEDVVLATIAGALRRELAAAAETPTKPLVAGVYKEQRSETPRHARSAPGRVQLQRLPIHIGLAAARLRMIRRDQEQGPDLLPEAWHRALAEWADANAPIVFSLMARVAREFDISGELARVANLIVSFVGDAGARAPGDDLRVEHLYPLGPTPEGINLHVAAQRIGAAVDLGIVATGDTLPDPWRFAAGLGDSLRELADAALALMD
jgi:diacylglycerol O-acyltransferase